MKKICVNFSAYIFVLSFFCLIFYTFSYPFQVVRSPSLQSEFSSNLSDSKFSSNLPDFKLSSSLSDSKLSSSLSDSKLSSNLSDSKLSDSKLSDSKLSSSPADNRHVSFNQESIQQTTRKIFFVY